MGDELTANRQQLTVIQKGKMLRSEKPAFGMTNPVFRTAMVADQQHYTRQPAREQIIASPSTYS